MIWDAASGECLLKMPAGSYQFAVAFSPDGRRCGHVQDGGHLASPGVWTSSTSTTPGAYAPCVGSVSGSRRSSSPRTDAGSRR